MSVARARAGLKLQKDKKAGGGRRGRERQDWTIQAGRIEKGKSVESRGRLGQEENWKLEACAQSQKHTNSA